MIALKLGGGVTNDEEIQKIEDELQGRFGPETFCALKSVSNLLSNCKTKEEIDMIMQDWKYVFGETELAEIIEGLISLKNIEQLLLADIAEEDLESYNEDIQEVNLQIDLLREYNESVLTLGEQEMESILVQTDNSISKGKLQQVLEEYNENPVSTPNCALFITDSIERDIKIIDDKETLEDIFLLIEQLKNGHISHQTSSLEIGEKDVYHMKPTSMGRQARVAYTRLSGNIYGIIQLYGKKADNPKSTITTLKNRVKNCNLKQLKKDIEDPEVFDYYVERTKAISSKLREEVEKSYKGKKENSSEGVKLG